jgi:hypothetical protein
MVSVEVFFSLELLALTSGKTMAAKHLESVPEASKKRYSDKILNIGGLDPYEIPSQSWSDNKDLLPEVNHARIVQYFVLGTSHYTCDQFGAYKSLNAYKSCVSGWVRDVRCYKPDGCLNTVVSAKVNILHPCIKQCIK